MNYKKIMAVLLALTMIFSFAACGKKEEPAPTPSKPVNQQQTEQKPAEQKPAEQTPVEQKPAETTPEQKPAEVVPEKTPTAVTPEKTPTEVAPKDPTVPSEPVIAPPTPAVDPKIENLSDGVYTVDVKTDGGTFKITEGHNGKGMLYVSGGKMTANIVLSGNGELAVFNVSSIGSEFEIKSTVGKGAWDGHKVTVSTPVKISTKSVTPTLVGGTGKTTVKAAETFTDLDGRTMAVLTWSSKSLDWLEKDGVQYTLINPTGECKFVVPVELGVDMPISVQTSAMSAPHVIEYTLNLQ